MFSLRVRLLELMLVVSLSTLTPTAQAETAAADNSDSAEIVEEMVVFGYRERTYGAKDASAGTLFDLPLDETPFNISVITEDLIDDLQLNTLYDAVQLNASVSRTHSHSKNAVGFQIRGFALSADQQGYLLNGVPVSSFDAPPAHTSALERIEVLKGTGNRVKLSAPSHSRRL